MLLLKIAIALLQALHLPLHAFVILMLIAFFKRQYITFMTSLFMHWFVLSGRFHLPSLTNWLFQVNAAAEIIYDLVDPNANLIFGAVIDPSLSGQVSLSLFFYISDA